MNEPQNRRAHTARRIAKWIGAIFGSLVALTVFGTLAAYFGLQTGAGGRLLRGITVGNVNRSILGRLELGAVEFRGTTLVLHDVVLRDPEDVVVLRIARATVNYGLRGLLARRIEVNDLDLQRPEIYARRDPNGLNLMRALEPRHPEAQPPQPAQPKGKGWQVVLVRFALVDGVVDAVDAAHRFTLRQIQIAAAGRIQTTALNGEFHLALAGRLDGTGGLSGVPLSINIHMTADRGQPRGTADLFLKQLIAMTATVESTRDGQIELRGLRLLPALVAVFVPAWPVRVPLVLSGVARVRGDVASADLTLRGEGTSGSLVVRGDGNTADLFTPHGITIDARGIKLSDLIAGVPATAPASLAVNIPAGSSLRPAQLIARLNVDVPRTELARRGFGPLHADLAINGGVLDRLNVSLPLPGAALTADGGHRDGKTFVTVRLAATRLATLRAAAVALGAGELPVVDGAGHIELTGNGPLLVMGPAPRWSVVAQADVPHLTVGSTRTRGIAVLATLPDLTPEHQTVNVVASLVAPLKLNIELSARADTKTIETPRDGTSALETRRTDVELLRLALDYPHTRWSTRAPAYVTVETTGAPSEPESRVALKGFALHADAQMIAADARMDNKDIDATLRVNALRIQDLPGLENLGMKVAGLLDATVKASGDPKRPRVDAKVALRDGRADAYRGLAANVAITLLPNHTVEGTAHARAARMGNLTATFKGPAAMPFAATAPLMVTVDLDNVQVANLPLPPNAGIRAAGILQARIEARGTIGDPRIAVRVTGRGLAVEEIAKPAEDVVAAGHRDGDTDNSGGDAELANGRGPREVKLDSLAINCKYASPRLEARVDLVDDKHGSLRAAAHTEVALAELRAPTNLSKTMKTRSIAGSLRFTNLDPAAISAFVPRLKMVRGQISAAFDVRGTITDPELGGELSWRKGKLVVLQDTGGQTDRRNRQ